MESRPMDVVDSDGHVLEPADTWERYIDPAFRDRAIRIARDDTGLERLFFDNKPMELLRGNLGTLGGIELEPGQLGSLTREYTYAEGSPPGSYDPAERIKVLDAEGIDRVLLYPTIGICWEGNVDDPALASCLYAGVQPLDRRLLRALAEPALPGGPHLADRSRRCRRRGDPGTQGGLRWRLPFAPMRRHATAVD